MVYLITMTGEKDVQRMLKNIPIRIKKEGKGFTKRVSDFIVRSAKQRVAPGKTGTGALMESIEAVPIKNGYKIIAGKGAVNQEGVNYARYQEYGFAPHPVRIGKFHPASRIRQELKLSGVHGNRKIIVRRHTPFMTPAYISALNRLGIEMNRTGKNIVRGL